MGLAGYNSARLTVAGALQGFLPSSLNAPQHNVLLSPSEAKTTTVNTVAETAGYVVGLA